MSLLPSRRLPKKFSRRVSKETKRFVSRRRAQHKKLAKERWRRLLRRVQNAVKGCRQSALRWSVITLLALFILSLSLLLFSPVLQVREIKITRLTPRLDIEEIQQALSPMFGRHLFFLSSFDVSQLLEDQVTDIDNIHVGKSYPSILNVDISLHPIMARLYIADPESSGEERPGTGSIIDFLTDQGIYVVTTAAQDTETLPLITIVDWGARPQQRAVLLDPSFLERMRSAEMTLLRQFGQEVRRRTVYLRAKEFHLHLDDFTLWFDLATPLEDQFQRYRTFLSSIDIEEINTYIDLRVLDKVIYQ